MPDSPPDLRDLRLEDLRRAAEIYLALAYPSGVVPEAVCRRLQWAPGQDAVALVSHPPFERASRPDAAPIHALRLGNARYPHMKLQVQPWPTEVGYMLSVNTHDQVLGLDPGAVDLEAFNVLQAENARIKEAIEAAWDAAELPTFARYLRQYLQDHRPGE